MKKLLILTSVVSTIAILALMAACQTTGTSGVAQKESLLAQAGFKVKTVTTPKQQQRVSQLPPNVVSAVKYQGKLYYVYPTAKKDQIYVGKQAQYDAYKQALKAKIISQQAQQANQTAQQREQMLQGSPVWSGETAGPRHVQVQVFDGFGPLDPMQGDWNPIRIRSGLGATSAEAIGELLKRAKDNARAAPDAWCLRWSRIGEKIERTMWDRLKSF